MSSWVNWGTKKGGLGYKAKRVFSCLLPAACSKHPMHWPCASAACGECWGNHSSCRMHRVVSGHSSATMARGTGWNNEVALHGREAARPCSSDWCCDQSFCYGRSIRAVWMLIYMTVSAKSFLSAVVELKLGSSPIPTVSSTLSSAFEDSRWAVAASWTLQSRSVPHPRPWILSPLHGSPFVFCFGVYSAGAGYRQVGARLS